MSRPIIGALVAVGFLCGCHGPDRQPAAANVPERLPSSEVLMTAKFDSDAQAGTTIEITLRNVGERTLVFDTGLQNYPMADFAFSLELPDHEWLQLYCQMCMPGSFVQPTPYTIRLRPSQFLHFTLPLSTFVGSNPRTGTRIDSHALHGRLLVELQVPTPPKAKKNWPGYVSAFVPWP